MAKRGIESPGKKVIGKPCEGEPHARFNEGAVGESPPLYSTLTSNDVTDLTCEVADYKIKYIKAGLV